MNKEEFNWFWKDTTKEGVLNQFYYEHIQLREEIERINKAIEYIDNNTYYSTEKGTASLNLTNNDLYDLLEILRGED